MFVILLFSLLALQCAFAFPIDEKETIEWVPSRTAYARDFDRWFNWVPWGSNDERKKTPSIKERIQILESRQKVLFDLVRCKSYDEADCSQFRTQAETVFELPSNEQGLTPPTKILPGVTAPASKGQSIAATTAAPASTAAPVASSPLTSTAAPVENTSSEAPQSTTVSTEASSEPATQDTTQA